MTGHRSMLFVALLAASFCVAGCGTWMQSDAERTIAVGGPAPAGMGDFLMRGFRVGVIPGHYTPVTVRVYVVQNALPYVQEKEDRLGEILQTYMDTLRHNDIENREACALIEKELVSLLNLDLGGSFVCGLHLALDTEPNRKNTR